MGEQYTLKVVIDDSKIRELESRLNKLGGGSSGGSSGGSAGGGITGMLGKLGGGAGGAGGMMKNMAKLGGIAIGIIGIQKMMKQITGLMIQSSPMLQAMMKLFNTTVMMILRPFGDFIGFFLRPIMIYLLRNIALPMYQLLAPPLRQWGSTIGNTLIGFLTDPFGTLTQWWLSWNWFDGIGLNNIKEVLVLIHGVLKLFNIDLSGVSLVLSESFTTALDNITTGLTEAFDGITGFFTDSWAFITSTLQPAWDGLTAFFTSITDAFSNFVEWLKNIPFLGNLLFGGGDDSGSTTEPDSGVGNTNRGNDRGFSSSSSTETIVIIEGGLQLPGSTNDISPEVFDTIEKVKRNTRFS